MMLGRVTTNPEPHTEIDLNQDDEYGNGKSVTKSVCQSWWSVIANGPYMSWHANCIATLLSLCEGGGEGVSAAISPDFRRLFKLEILCVAAKEFGYTQMKNGLFYSIAEMASGDVWWWREFEWRENATAIASRQLPLPSHRSACSERWHNLFL